MFFSSSSKSATLLGCCILLGVLTACTGTHEVLPAPSASSSVSSFESSSLSRNNSEEPTEVGALPLGELAKAAGVGSEHASELVNNQGRRIALTEKLNAKYPDDVAYVWTTDPMMEEIHVSATSSEALEFALQLDNSISTHKVKYSYRQMEKIYSQLVNLVDLDLCVEDRCFVYFEPIESKIYINIDGLKESGKSKDRVDSIMGLIEEYPDLIIESNDFNKYRIDASDSSLLGSD